MPSSGTEKYGQFYYCIKTPLSKSGEIYVMADNAEFLADGTLVMIRTKTGDEPLLNLAIAPGQWTAVYAASLLDGAAVAVEHWDGKVKR